ncbi:MAG: RNA polymerase sigma factor [Lachnospiraceae bacterium]|nr:RNA polymerase sigma factor [Lachnospiraceae bacterium]
MHLIDTYQNLVFSICYKITGNYFDSEDLAQETFLSAYKYQARFDGRNEKAWVCKIATNKCLDYKRKSIHNQIPTEDTYFEELADTKAKTEENCLDTLVKEKLLRCCEMLKPPYDVISKDYFYQEKSVKEIAELYDKNEKTVQTQIYRAKTMLRKLYGKE